MKEVKLEKCKINEDVWLCLWAHIVMVSIVGVKETVGGSYKYDVMVAGYNGKAVRLYNIDHAHISKIHPKHTQDAVNYERIQGLALFSREDMAKCWSEAQYNLGGKKHHGYVDFQAFMQSFGK
ncbi:MAG: hypothetical protein V4547_16790 [Bacteroidota bacterium]